jgi:transposase
MPREKKNKSKKSASIKKGDLPESLQQVNLNAAGIDVGSSEHFVAVPLDRDPQPVQRFGAFTSDLYRLADWLKECGIETVVMESTGVYWIPLFQILETRGFEVKLVNAKHVKNVRGRKTDIVDCQWLQQLHTYGLLSGSFRPQDAICVLRSYLRHRANLIQQCTAHIQHMQKALIQMNILLHNVISNITGVTGLRIIEAILEGERDGVKLASLKDHRIKSSANEIARSLEGDYREEHLFALRQSLELYRFYHKLLDECDQKIQSHMQQFEPKVEIKEKPLAPRRTTHRLPQRNEPKVDWRTALYQMSGVDLTRIDGIDILTSQTIISEVGFDMSPWKSEKHFASWLGLCPNNEVTGGKVKNRGRRKVVNRAAQALRMAAQSLKNSKTALGAFFRRMRARLGPAKAITATAHKLSRIVYRMLKFGHEYVDQGEQYYQERYRERVIKSLKKRAHLLGLEVVEKNSAALASL